MKCKNCGQKNESSAQYCFNCGSTLELGGNKKVIIAIVIAAVVIALAIIGVIALGGDEEEETVPTDGTIEPQSASQTAPTLLEDGNGEAGSNVAGGGTPWFSQVYASSELSPEYGNTYEPVQVLDGSISTAWSEGNESTSGEGEWIQIHADDSQYVSGIEIVNGYSKSEDIYYKNCRIRELKVRFDDGSTETLHLEDEFAKYQRFDFAEPKNTMYIHMEIVSVYDGVKYGDACLSEVRAY